MYCFLKMEDFETQRISSHQMKRLNWTELDSSATIGAAIKENTNRISPRVAKRDSRGDTAW